MTEPLRKVREFRTDDPAELQRALAELERNADRVTRELGSRKHERPTVSIVRRSDCNAQLDELVLCDPSTAAFTVALPKQTRNDVGRGIVVKNVSSSANTITIRACKRQLVDGSETASISASLGVCRLVADGLGNWWVL